MDLWQNARELEAEADRLLAEAEPDPEYPAYPERTMLRRGKNYEIGLEDLRDSESDPEDPTAGVSLELVDRLLESLALRPRDAQTLGLHLWGWGQQEIARALGVTQQCVAKRLERCLLASEDPRLEDPYAGWYQVYLEEVHRTVYRKPSYGRRRYTRRRSNSCVAEGAE